MGSPQPSLDRDQIIESPSRLLDPVAEIARRIASGDGGAARDLGALIGRYLTGEAAELVIGARQVEDAGTLRHG